MANNEFVIENISDDGTIEISSDGWSGSKHIAADAFLEELSKLMGGKIRLVEKKKAHVHVKGHTHTHQH